MQADACSVKAQLGLYTDPGLGEDPELGDCIARLMPLHLLPNHVRTLPKLMTSNNHWARKQSSILRQLGVLCMRASCGS